MKYAIRKYQEVMTWFTQESKINEKEEPILDSNNIEIEYISIQFPNYMGTKINILV